MLNFFYIFKSNYTQIESFSNFYSHPTLERVGELGIVLEGEVRVRDINYRRTYRNSI